MRKSKNNQDDNNTIKVRYSRQERQAQKAEYLDIQGGEYHNITTLQNNELLILEYDDFYKTYLKFDLKIPEKLLTQKNKQEYIDEAKKIFSRGDMKLRFVHKNINLNDVKTGVQIMPEQTNEFLADYKKLQEELISDTPAFLEYYIEIENFDKEDLIQRARSYIQLSESLKIFSLSIPNKTTYKFLVEKFAIGDTNVEYLTDHMVIDRGLPTQYFVKYYVVTAIDVFQEYFFWEKLTRYGFCDVLMCSKCFSRKDSKEFIKNSRFEHAHKSKGTNEDEQDEWADQSQLLRNVSSEIRNGRDRILGIKFCLRFVGKDLDLLTENINNFIQDFNDSFRFENVITRYRSIDEFYLGFDDNLVKAQYTNLNRFVFGAGWFSNAYIQDGGFITNTGRNSLLMLNRRVPNEELGKYNYNELYFGVTGAGKSTSLKLNICEDLCFGDKIIAIDSAKEYYNLAKEVDGAIIELGLGADSNKINPFDVCIIRNEDTGETIIDYDRLIEFISFLTFLEDRQVVYYKRYLRDICSEIEGVPTFKVLHTHLQQPKYKSEEYSNFKAIIEDLTTTYPMFNDVTSIDLNAQFIVFGLQQLKGNSKIRTAVTYLIVRLVDKYMTSNKFYKDYNSNLSLLEQISNYADKKHVDIDDILIKYRDLMENATNLEIEQLFKKLEEEVNYKIEKETPKIKLIIDECHNFLDMNELVEYVDIMAREGRKYNAGIILATQTPRTFFAGKNAEKIKELHDSITARYYLTLADSSQVDLANEYAGAQFTDSQKDLLTKGDLARGEGILLYPKFRFLFSRKLRETWKPIFAGGK